MKTRFYFAIERTILPINNEYEYNIQVYRNTKGKDYYYTGIGKFCKSEEECMNYAEEYRASHKSEQEVRCPIMQLVIR